MRKYTFLSLIVLAGLSISLNASARDIPMKHGVAKGAKTTILANGGTLYRVSGYASTGNCTFSIHDSDGFTASDTAPANNNTMAEGGEASQYDSFPSLDFGEDGIPFETGLSIVTSACDVSVAYR